MAKAEIAVRIPELRPGVHTVVITTAVGQSNPLLVIVRPRHSVWHELLELLEILCRRLRHHS